jgi:hypothetical protein
VGTLLLCLSDIIHRGHGPGLRNLRWAGRGPAKPGGQCSPSKASTPRARARITSRNKNTRLEAYMRTQGCQRDLMYSPFSTMSEIGKLRVYLFSPRARRVRWTSYFAFSISSPVAGYRTWWAFRRPSFIPWDPIRTKSPSHPIHTFDTPTFGRLYQRQDISI